MNAPARHTNRYRACGLQIGSVIPFPELPVVRENNRPFSPDIELDVGTDIHADASRETVVLSMVRPEGGPWLTCTKTDEGYRFHFPELADFLVDRHGRHVSFIAQPTTAPETIRHLFLDQVIPPLLNLRGREALHASAVETESGACAFIGPSGRGKSTLAAAFHLAGHPVLCDDCLLLNDEFGQIRAEPAYPGLRLWEDGCGKFFGDATHTGPVSDHPSKRRVATPELNHVESLLLRAIYVLVGYEDGNPLTKPVIEPLSMRDAFMELFQCAFRLDLTDQAMIKRQMEVLERVTREVPIKRLRLPEDLGALPAARDAILRDLKPG